MTYYNGKFPSNDQTKFHLADNATPLRSTAFINARKLIDIRFLTKHITFGSACIAQSLVES